VAVVFLAFESGFRVELYWCRRSQQEDWPRVGAMVADTLVLLAFTFGLAASRFDVRRGQYIEVANAIGTNSLRGGLLPELHRAEVQTILLRASIRRHAWH
jgi:hypothetical protein